MFRTCIFLLLPIFTFSQIRINVAPENTAESAILQIDNSKTQQKGILFPRLELIKKDDFSPFKELPVIGTMVFNTLRSDGLELGVYNWNGNEWELSSSNSIKEFIAQRVNEKTLGYVPFTEKPDSIVQGKNYMIQLATPNNTAKAYASMINCSKWTEGNKNTYCIYNVSSSIGKDVPLNLNLTWLDAFNFAKARGGHLVTITEDSEWEFLKKTVLNKDYTNHSASDKASWIGLIRMNMRYTPFGVSTATNRDRMRFNWVTDEISVMNWNDQMSQGRRTQSHFEKGYPFIAFDEPVNTTNSGANNNDVTSYAVYIRSQQPSTERLWRVIKSNGVNEQDKTYLQDHAEYSFPTSFSVPNGNRDAFQSMSIIVEYTNTK